MERILIIFSLQLFFLCLAALLNTGIAHHVIESNCHCSRPPAFPKSVELIKTQYENFDGRVIGKNIWTAFPRSAHEIVTIANWARQHHFKVRPHGASQSSSPLVIMNGTNCRDDQLILLDAQKHLTAMKIVRARNLNKAGVSVEVQAGVTLLSLLDYLGKRGYGLPLISDFGGLTIMGIIASGSYGNTPRAPKNGTGLEGSFITLSSTVMSFRAVIWSSFKNKYILRRFDRSHFEAKALLVSLGRNVLTSVTLAIVDNYNVQLRSLVDIPAKELLGMPSSGDCQTKRTLACFIVPNDSIDLIWYPYIDRTWLKTKTVQQVKPLTSKYITSYAFENQPSTDEIDELQDEVSKGNFQAFPKLQMLQFEESLVPFLKSNNLLDVWGSSKDVNLGKRSGSEKNYVSGFVIITSLGNVQNVIGSHYQFYLNLLKKYTDRDVFPAYKVNIRINRVDTMVFGDTPTLSPAKEIEGHPELDTTIWIQMVSDPNAPGFPEFLSEIEQFYYTRIHDGRTEFVRPEWPKNFAHTTKGAFTNTYYLKYVLPSLFPASSKSDGWDWAISIFDKYDPSRTFADRFTEQLLTSARM